MNDRDEPVPLGTAVDAVVRSLKGTSADALGGVFQRWVDAVGEQVARHATPVSLDRGRLLVEVDEPGWATQLRYLEPQLLAQVAEVAGPGVVTAIDLRVGRRPPPRR